MGILSSKKPCCSIGCLTTKWLAALLLFVVTIAALVGIFETHIVAASVEPTRYALQFGSTGGSLAILAFTVSLLAWMKHMVAIMKRCEVCNGK
ncbi:MAG: hypothetical protein WC840_01965 [Candidatus Peribacteraceae bacterium]